MAHWGAIIDFDLVELYSELDEILEVSGFNMRTVEYLLTNQANMVRIRPANGGGQLGLLLSRAQVGGAELAELGPHND